MGNNGKVKIEDIIAGERDGAARTTVGIKFSTKERLDSNKAPGQCYEGFICQLVDLWEKTEASRGDSLLNIDSEG